MKTTISKTIVEGRPTQVQLSYELWSQAKGRELKPNSIGTDAERDFRGADTEKPMGQRWPILGAPKLSKTKSEFYKNLHKSQKFLARFNKPATIEECLLRPKMRVKLSQDTELKARESLQKELLKTAAKVSTPCGETLTAVFKKGDSWMPVSGHYLPCVPENEKMFVLQNPAADSEFFIVEMADGSIRSASCRYVRTSKMFHYYTTDHWDTAEEKDTYSKLAHYLQGNFRKVEFSKELLGLCKSAKAGAQVTIEGAKISLTWNGKEEFSETAEYYYPAAITFSAKYLGKIGRQTWMMPIDVVEGMVLPSKSENADGSFALLMPCKN